MSNNEESGAPGRDVVVGVDGSPASQRALRYAVAEAGRLETGLHLVHAVPLYLPMTPMYPLPLEDLTSLGRDLLRRKLADARAPDSMHLTTTLSRMGAVPALVAASKDAAVVVLGADRRPTAPRIFTGNVATGVAAGSSVPVITVPETWHSREAAGVVLVGIKRPDSSAQLLAEAFAIARLRTASLRVLHAWRLPSGYDDMIAHHADYTDWDERARKEVTRAVAEWQVAYSDVDVEISTVHDQAAQALVRASEEVDEIVLVRRAHGVPAALHLGSTARAVLAHAHCPVRIVPAGHRMDPPDPVLEAAGALTR